MQKQYSSEEANKSGVIQKIWRSKSHELATFLSIAKHIIPFLQNNLYAHYICIICIFQKYISLLSAASPLLLPTCGTLYWPTHCLLMIVLTSALFKCVCLYSFGSLKLSSQQRIEQLEVLYVFCEAAWFNCVFCTHQKSSCVRTKKIIRLKKRSKNKLRKSWHSKRLDRTFCGKFKRWGSKLPI